jgi:hypothetical protein
MLILQVETHASIATLTMEEIFSLSNPANATVVAMEDLFSFLIIVKAANRAEVTGELF